MKIEQLGPYQIVEELGRGGMGTVFEAVNLETGDAAAVKLLAAALAREEGLRDRFAGEIETLRKLNHPNIVRLFGFGQQEGHLFYAMELVDGNSLEEELSRGRRFDWREVTQLGIEICQALRHAHDRGVIHRDIKPGNLLLTRDGHVKLADFGIARLFGNSRLTNPGSVLGTAEYMAPEQAEGRPVDVRSDLYSLGVVLYVLLTRRQPFQGKSVAEVLHKQRYETPEPARRHAADCPAELEEIVAQLLDKDPERRPVNATLVGRRLSSMQRALSLLPGTLSGDAEEDDQRAAPAGPAVAIAPHGAADVDGWAPTRALEMPSRPEGAAEGVKPSTDDLPDTMATGALLPAGAVESPAPPKPAARFISVDEKDLDRDDLDEEPPRHALVAARTWVLAAALIAVGLAVWHFLQPLSADRLYDRIQSRVDGTGASLVQAEGDIEEFLVRFPRDLRAQQVRGHQREIALYRLERKFDRRAKDLPNGEHLLPVERAYLEAVNYARLDPDLGIAKLQALIDLYDHRPAPSGPTGQCLDLARRRLEQLRRQVDPEAAGRLDSLQDRLDAADQSRATDPEHARAMYQAVVELYADKPWAAAAVQRARAALGKDAAEKGEGGGEGGDGRGEK